MPGVEWERVAMERGRRTRGTPSATAQDSPSRPAPLIAVLQPENLRALQRAVGNRTVADRVVQRRTAQEIKDARTDFGGLNLNEEGLASDLVPLVRSGQYSLVSAVFALLEPTDKDDVAQEVVGALTNLELINAARDAAGRAVLSLMASELRSGWNTADETRKSDLLQAVVGDQGARFLYNRARILTIKTSAVSDLDALARLFSDDEIVDDGTVQSRLTVVLSATEHVVVPGLQTGVSFSDTGLAGDRTPNGPGFRDPHPSSQNQPGHFLTAAGLQFSPAVVSRDIPLFGTIRQMVQAPAGMPDEQVALRLTIGHEKGPDPDGVDAFMKVAFTAGIESLLPGPEGETEEQREQRIGGAIIAETRRQVNEIIAAFRTQFQACTDDDITAWQQAIEALGVGATLDMSAAEVPLGRIAVDPTMRGNSRQDLRLSLVGWRFGQLISGGRFPDRSAAAAWLRSNLGPGP
jgi:hypothetical protein